MKSLYHNTVSGKSPLVNFPPVSSHLGSGLGLGLGWGNLIGRNAPGGTDQGGGGVPSTSKYSFLKTLSLSPTTSIHAAKLSAGVYLLLMFTLLNSNYIMKSAFLVQFPFVVNQSFLYTRYVLLYCFKRSSWQNIRWYVKGNS